MRFAVAGTRTFALGMLAACAATSGQIVSDTRELSESSSAPSLSKVEDIGPSDVLLTAPLAPQPSDGIAVVGELLWLHGSNIGRRPTVLIAGESVPVLVRTEDEGVVVRVPPSAPSGRQTVVLANDRGEARAPLEIVRRVVVRAPGDGQLLTLTQESEGPRGPARALGEPAHAFAASEEGRAVYALRQPSGTAAQVEVLALAAQGGPRGLGSLDLATAGIGSSWGLDVSTASGHAALFVYGDKGVGVFDLSSPLKPVPRPSLTWPRKLGPRALRHAATSADGRWLALADGAESQVTLMSLGDSLQVVTAENLLPELRANAIADLAFARDGRRLFVLLGPTTDGARVGNPEPTKLVVLALSADRRRWVVASSTPLPDIKWPTALREARVRHLQSGASIRRPSATLPLFIAGRSAAAADQAVVLRIEGEVIKPMATLPGFVLGLAEAPDGRWLLASVVDAEGSMAKPRVVGLVVDDRPGASPTVLLEGTAPRGTSERAAAPQGRALEVQP